MFERSFRTRFFVSCPQKMADQRTPLVCFWFRRDLRADDNHAFFQALSSGWSVLPIYIIDDDIRLPIRYEALRTLRSKGVPIRIYTGRPSAVFNELLQTHTIRAVYANVDREPQALKRDKEVQDLLQQRDVAFHTYVDRVLFDAEAVLKSDGKPYTVFTPYANAWKKRLQSEGIPHYPSESLLQHTYDAFLPDFPDASSLGISSHKPICTVPVWTEQQCAAYAQTRDYPALDATSHWGTGLSLGMVSPRALIRFAQQHSTVWLNELIWREFFQSILAHFPHVEHKAFKPAYDWIDWRNDEAAFEKWCSGTTGIPLVDAGMRQLNQTGWMHNRVRMITAGFLVKHLLIDWRLGEAYFAQKLLDYELASNNGNWQWAAGSGCDAAPYFRVFNPLLQAKKFDPHSDYIRKWLPEWGSPDYPLPLLDLNEGRDRAIRTYKKALSAV